MQNIRSNGIQTKRLQSTARALDTRGSACGTRARHGAINNRSNRRMGASGAVLRCVPAAVQSGSASGCKRQVHRSALHAGRD